MDGGEHIVLDQALGDDDRVLEVVTVKGRERDEHVLADGQLAFAGRGAVGDDLVRLDLVADADDRPLVLAGALVEADELAKLVLVGVVDDDALGVDESDRAAALGLDDHAGVLADDLLHARGHRWRLGDDQRDRLPLHVGAHQGPVGVVVLQEGDQRRRHSDDLLGRDVHVLHVVRLDRGQVAADAGEDVLRADLAGLVEHIRRGQDRLHLLVGPQVLDLAGHLAPLDLAVGREQETVLVDLAVNAQRRDEADVGAFRGLDGADAAVVRDVDVTHLEAGALAVQAAGAQGRETPLVDEHGQGVGLVHHL